MQSPDGRPGSRDPRLPESHDGAPWRWIGAAVLGLAVATACAPKASRRQTDIMEKTGKVSVSAAVLRARVNDLVDRFAGRVEQTADRIIAENSREINSGGALRRARGARRGARSRPPVSR